MCTSTHEPTNLSLSRMLSHTHKWVTSHLIESCHVCISTDKRTNLSIHWQTNQSFFSLERKPHRTQYMYIHWYVCALTCMCTDMYVHWHMCTDMYMHWHVYALPCISTRYTCQCMYMYMQWSYIHLHPLTHKAISSCHVCCHAHIPTNESCRI